MQLSHPYITTGKTIALTRQTFVGKVMSLLFNMVSRLVIDFSSKDQVSFNSMAAVTICSDFGAQKNKVCHCFHCILIYLPWSNGLEYDISFWMLSFKPTFSLSSLTFIKKLFSSFSLSALRVISLHIWGYWYFSWQSWFQVILHPAQCFSWCALHRN